MKPNLQDLDAVIAMAKNLRAAQVDFERCSAKARDAGIGASDKRRRALMDAMSIAAIHVERCWDDLHACAVDLGLAVPHDITSYRQRAVHPSAFHEQAYMPRIPRVIKERLTIGATIKEDLIVATNQAKGDA